MESSTSTMDVFWEDPVDQDPANPMNWSVTRKWTIIAAVSFTTFLTPLASSMFAPGVPLVMEEFHSSSTTLATFVVSVYILGFAFGPLIVAPWSEYSGRVIVYNTCNLLFLIFNIASALSPNLAALIVFRFLDGVVGVTPTTIGSGTIADLMPPESRGRAMAFWSLGPLFGPIVGPVAGGFLVEATNWRWVFWVLSIAIQSGVVSTAFFFIVPETDPATILRRKAARLQKETGETAYKSRLDDGIPPKERFVQSLVRPTRMLLFSPIVAAMCVYIAILYGLLYILFTTFTEVFEGQYGFSSGASGLSFLGSGVGMLVGLVYSGTLSDKGIKRKLENKEPLKPEDRLPSYITLPGALSIPVGLFVYGWSTDKHLHWIVPEIGTAITGYGMIVILMAVQTYLVDAFTKHAASAIAACTVLRSLAGGFLPLCGLKLYDRLGLGWGNTLLGFIALGISPIPFMFQVFGERLRKN
ncbi:hypothetical protein ASPZODRAFT_2129058 [Penicilliopsis zonata CBS 506.65]|uniref:Major facilitator superfamily (MFS) profile domain-containing protein n=1 Tax=Penicilliopsis zonata CBS 506.65 TaxID=1073090 RepID=A0A1L9SJP6_9EURO|nr:hypothetical protein ASPZODRAFT_2129058 [Penicilliopsis zonata CBS 506.65]OJJ47341.1 hypothetical protein ASPZODRAFT_2129058 [Penicilliopsis zonata CBS 506.65]